MPIPILVAALVAAAPAIAPAASFDCARAASRVEQMICAEPTLRAMDRGIALFYASGRRSHRAPYVVAAQVHWLAAERNRCQTAACLRQKMSDRLWQLSEATGADLPRYTDQDAEASLVVAELGGGWYAFGALGYWHGPTENSAAASGAFHLAGSRADIPAPGDDDCAATIERLPRDGWRLTTHPTADLPMCGGMNATVDGSYRRGRR